MTRQQARRVIVGLGVGRSGTSLLMQVLHKLGMDVSKIMTPPSEQNHLGGYEDTDIFTTHNEILRLLQTNQLLPLPDNWLLNPGLDGIKQKLSRIVEEHVQMSQKIWGFKDPRTVLFLPLWFQIFNALKIVPINICAVRAPGPTIRSLEIQYNQNKDISELFWLNKTCAALSHTGGNCHIVHYEDWFTRPVEQAQSLLKFTGLDQYFTSDVQEVLSSVIKPNLNRAIYDDIEVKNKYVLKLYDVLQDCRGDDFDHVQLMGVVKECRKAMDEFKGWYLEAHRYLGQQSKIREQRERVHLKAEDLAGIVDKGQRKVEELASALEKERRKAEELAAALEMERRNVIELANTLEMKHRKTEGLVISLENERRNAEELAGTVDKERRKAEELTSDVNRIRRKAKELASVVDKERRKSKKLASTVEKKRQELTRVKKFFSYRLGNVLVTAVKKPGWKTVRLPYDVTKLFVTALAERKNKELNIKENLSAYSQSTEPSQRKNGFDDATVAKQGKTEQKPSNAHSPEPAQKKISYVSALERERNRQSKLELESAQKKKISLTNEYAMAEARIADLSKKFEYSSDSEAKSNEMTEAVLKANRVLMELKDTEDATVELRIRCQAGNIRPQ